MKLTKELTEGYRFIFNEMYKLAILPIDLGRSLGLITASFIISNENRSRENTERLTNAFETVGATAGVIFGFTETMPVTLLASFLIALSGLITYPISLTLDLIDYLVSSNDENHNREQLTYVRY